MYKYIFFIVGLFLVLSTQTKAVNTDSLQAMLSSVDNDSSKIKLLFKLGDYYSDAGNDSSIIFYTKIIDIAKKTNNQKILCRANLNLGYYYLIFNKYDEAEKYIFDALRINSTLKNNYFYSSIYNNLGILYKHKNQKEKAIKYFLKTIAINKQLYGKNSGITSYINIANIYNQEGNYKKAIEYYKKAEKNCLKSNDLENLSKAYNGIGVVYYQKGNYNKAIEYFHNTLNTKEKLNDLRGMSLCYNNLGLVLYEQENYYQSINYYNRALELFKKQKNKIGVANSYSNIGIVYADKGDNEKALTYYFEALKIFEEINDDYDVSNTYANVGSVYLSKKEFKKSEKYLNKSLQIKRKINDKDGISNVLINLSNLYNSLGDSTNNIKYYKKAITYANEGLKIAKDIGTKPNEKIAYESLENSYFKLNDINNAYKYLKLFIQVKDSLFNEKKMKEIENLEAKFQNKQKQEEIEKNKILIAKKNAETKQLQAEESKQRMQKWFFIAGFILILFIAFYIYKNYKQKQKANSLLREQKKQIQEKNVELNQQNEEILAQRDEIESQKNKIEIIHKSLSESIDYAKNIQKSILPNFEIINKLFPDNFLFFKPKDIVSGDFYWWSKINNNIIITIADCTGHGVPGAFMSMLGISFLREIVNKEKIIQPDKILNKLKKEIIIALKQTGAEGEQKDGMDMAIISINLDTNVVQFSGANNPLYLIKNEKLKIKDEESSVVKLYDNSEFKIQNPKLLYEVKPDKMPIGIYKRSEDFTLHQFQLEKGDSIYLFSDGYADQFGGEKGKKFKYKPFKRLLLENADKPMQEQKIILEKTFNEWKKDIPQIDDVTVMGIRI